MRRFFPLWFIVLIGFTNIVHSEPKSFGAQLFSHEFLGRVSRLRPVKLETVKQTLRNAGISPDALDGFIRAFKERDKISEVRLENEIATEKKRLETIFSELEIDGPESPEEKLEIVKEVDRSQAKARLLTELFGDEVPLDRVGQFSVTASSFDENTQKGRTYNLEIRYQLSPNQFPQRAMRVSSAPGRAVSIREWVSESPTLETNELKESGLAYDSSHHKNIEQVFLVDQAEHKLNLIREKEAALADTKARIQDLEATKKSKLHSLRTAAAGVSEQGKRIALRLQDSVVKGVPSLMALSAIWLASRSEAAAHEVPVELQEENTTDYGKLIRDF